MGPDLDLQRLLILCTEYIYVPVCHGNPNINHTPHSFQRLRTCAVSVLDDAFCHQPSTKRLHVGKVGLSKGRNNKYCLSIDPTRVILLDKLTVLFGIGFKLSSFP